MTCEFSDLNSKVCIILEAELPKVNRDFAASRASPLKKSFTRFSRSEHCPNSDDKSKVCLKCSHLNGSPENSDNLYTILLSKQFEIIEFSI